MSDVIDLTGDDVRVNVNALPAPGRGRVPLNNRQRERDRRRLQQRANRKKKRIATARAGIPDIPPDDCYCCLEQCTYKTVPRRWDFPMCRHWLCEDCYVETLEVVS